MILIGIDAGASRTRLAVWRDGERLAADAGPGTAIRTGRVLPSAMAMSGQARSLLARSGLTRADVLVVGAAGAGRAADADELRGALRGEHIAERIVVTTDIALALAAFPEPSGVVLLAGTGSVAMAKAADGTSTWKGGLGWQMGDEGSGYWIGREALRAVGLASDGRGPDTALTDLLLRATGSPAVRELAAWASGATNREVAGMARLTVLAAPDDPVAAAIVDRAAGELADLVQSAANGLGPGPLALGIGGGLLDGADSPLAGRVVTALRARNLTVTPTRVEPLDGAPALATS